MPKGRQTTKTATSWRAGGPTARTGPFDLDPESGLVTLAAIRLEAPWNLAGFIEAVETFQREYRTWEARLRATRDPETVIPRDRWRGRVQARHTPARVADPLAAASPGQRNCRYFRAVAKGPAELSRDLPAQIGNEWTPAKLHARQEQLARRAVHLWRADFA